MGISQSIFGYLAASESLFYIESSFFELLFFSESTSLFLSVENNPLFSCLVESESLFL